MTTYILDMSDEESCLQMQHWFYQHYVGQRCTYCNEPFLSSQDVLDAVNDTHRTIVCSGIPHMDFIHAACYMKRLTT